MKKIKNIYDNAITFENVYQTWNIVRKTCKNKRAIFRFSVNKNTNIYNIYKALKTKKYQPLSFRLFLIFEPKPRLVMSQSVSDKIVNHFVTNFYLLPYLEKKLIDSNVATRKGKGSKYANELFEKYINKIRLKNANSEIYCLNIDISKYFYSIDHKLLIEKLKKDIEDNDVIEIIERIIGETNKSYVNELIIKFNQKYQTNIPVYKSDIGLSIGAMTSQFLAIYYLNDLDHYIKEKLKCKYYIRYMDDFIILDTDVNHLKSIWKEIENQINLLNLKLNPKSNIIRLSNGLSFLGYKYKIQNGKLKTFYRKKTIKKILSKLKYLENTDKIKYYRTYSSYYGYLKKVKFWERNFKMKAIEKYDYYKEKWPNHIIFIKEGSFYKTFKDDAIIIWYLFGYKWNNDAISFGASPYSKVLDKLNHLSISYCVIASEEFLVNNDIEMYELYQKISYKNFLKVQKKEQLHELLDKVLEFNDKKYEEIFNFLSKMKEVEEDGEKKV